MQSSVIYKHYSNLYRLRIGLGAIALTAGVALAIIIGIHQGSFPASEYQRGVVLSLVGLSSSAFVLFCIVAISSLPLKGRYMEKLKNDEICVTSPTTGDHFPGPLNNIMSGYISPLQEFLSNAKENTQEHELEYNIWRTLNLPRIQKYLRNLAVITQHFDFDGDPIGRLIKWDHETLENKIAILNKINRLAFSNEFASMGRAMAREHGTLEFAIVVLLYFGDKDTKIQTHELLDYCSTHRLALGTLTLLQYQDKVELSRLQTRLLFSCSESVTQMAIEKSSSITDQQWKKILFGCCSFGWIETLRECHSKMPLKTITYLGELVDKLKRRRDALNTVIGGYCIAIEEIATRKAKVRYREYEISLREYKGVYLQSYVETLQFLLELGLRLPNDRRCLNQLKGQLNEPIKSVAQGKFTEKDAEMANAAIDETSLAIKKLLVDYHSDLKLIGVELQ